jgi:hypothetical protein
LRQSKYPDPYAIAQTIAHEQTSLIGVRQFYASAGVVVYAYDRLGMANVARRTWLAPGATRRLGTFLDIVTPAVGGLLMNPAGVQPPQLDVGGPRSAAGRLRELAEANLNSSQETHRVLCAVDDSEQPGWDWTGVLRYDHRHRLRTGQYVMSRSDAVFHVRGDVQATRAHILVEIRHPTDLREVHSFLARLLPSAERWGIVPVVLLDDSRHDEIRSVVDAIGAGGEVIAANPNTQRSDNGSIEDENVAEFVQSMREARYSTTAQGLDSLIERAENVDHARLSAFDLYHWVDADPRSACARVRLKQHGTDPLTIEWGSAREPFAANGTRLPGPLRLSAETWEQMTAADWSDDRKMQHLCDLWSRLIGAVQDGAASAAA